MLVGEILLEQGWVAWDALAIALDDQRGTDVRIVSLLVARKHITFDHGARALGQLHGVRGALQRHLQQRDRTVVGLLGIELMRTSVVIPLGRMADGTLIVVARDPSAAIEARLARALAEPFVLAVAPAAELERVIAQAIAARVVDDIEVTVDDGMSGELDVNLDDDRSASSSFDDLRIEVDAPRMREPSIPPPIRSTSRALPVDIKPIAPARPLAADSLEGVLAALRDVDDRRWMLDIVEAYLRRRWHTSLVLAPNGGNLCGVRGHGPMLVEDVILPLDATADTPALAAPLGNPPRASWLRVTRDDQLVYVLALGEPREGAAEDLDGDLELLTLALTETLARI